ncbi:ParA family protein [Catelliglobosispora koreensis]|uniref:ParA family protein n=1 Tax=Catelliglobosispora koreensis TaxID=129052 RepID=UPI00038248CE|nr:ParA family protein [Catelliglobosispora koreensis]
MTTEDALAIPDHLYTWVDIDEYFAALAARGQWETWLLEVDAYWDSVEFTVADGTPEDTVWEWLTSRLGPLTVDASGQAILLESVNGAGQPLPVRLRESSEVPPPNRRPQWNERRIVPQLVDSLEPPAIDRFSFDVQICAFHSFKGGTGRTLHCLALARELANLRQNQPMDRGRVLLIDADFEAPGITWMVSSQGNRLDFSLKDLLALLHGSPTGDISGAVALARKFLANQELGGIVVLPAMRDPMRLSPLRIEPGDLLTHQRSPYFLTEALAEVANAVGADTVLIDLRAGTSELSAPVLLDPRVHRVFVTTVSDQSVRGTGHLIREIGHRAPSRLSTDPACSVLITQFQEKEHSSHLSAVTGELADALASTVRVLPALDGVAGGTASDSSAVDRDVATQPMSSPFDSRLLALPATWDEMCDLIGRVELPSVVSRLAHTLRPPTAPKGISTETPFGDDLAAARQALRELAERLVYAESATGDDDFLPTEALTNLVSKHRTEAPVEVVVGAKGSGKTFTYLRMCRQGNWAQFAEAAGVSGVELAAPILPVMASQHLVDSLREQIVDVQHQSANLLTNSTPATFLELRDLIVESLDQDLNDVAWRRVWLTCLARAAGLNTTPATVEQDLTALARDHRVVFVLDGLEDLFQRFSTDASQQRALRALLTGCPEWLRSLRGRPLGLVVFVRRDLVLNSIQQNTDQFFARHQAYELRWNRTEALRLATWVCDRASVIRIGDGEDTRTASAQALSMILTQVWGQKLGSDSSREARSEDWFFAALSDFNLQIQARDIVSFLFEATGNALEDERIAARWNDRLLPPTAMRRALPACSREKIRAISQENPPVGELFRRLREVPEDVRKVPFVLETVGLSATDARLLEANGVLFREEDQYWIPEIYRHGLEFGVTGTGRPRVLAVAKLIRRRNDSA